MWRGNGICRGPMVKENVIGDNKWEEYASLIWRSRSKETKAELWRMQNRLKWWRMKDRNVLTDRWKEPTGRYKNFTEELMNEYNDKTEMVEWWRYNKECERWTRTNRGTTHYQSTLVLFRRMAWIALKSNFNGLSVPFTSVFRWGNDLCIYAACWGYLKNKWSAFRGQQHHSLQRDTIINVPSGIITFMLYFNVFVFIQHY